jgi:phage antirepressor YoqD-like protein
MSELQIINRQEVLGKDFKVYGTPDEPLFLAKDVAEWIEHSDSAKMVQSVDDNEKLLRTLFVSGQNREVWFLTEDGFYEVLMQCRKLIAKQFKAKVKEILKTIRRHGMYATNELLDNPDLLIEAATRIKIQREKIEALETTVAVQSQQLAEAAPKVSYYDLILNCKDLISISKIAKDYGMSAVKMNETLRELGIQFRQGNVWLLYQKYAAQGYTSTKTHEYIGSDGTNHARTATYWTQKGRVWLYNKLKENGILPVIEREVS